MRERKQLLRRQAYDARNTQTHKDERSRIIVDKLINLPEYHAADTVMWYLHHRSEVRTQDAVRIELKAGKRIIVPYCTKDENGDNKLHLWHLHSLEEMVEASWGLLEPPKERWGEHGREPHPQELDLIIVPGVGFDRNGGRIGNGQGYYDRLLAQVRDDTTLIGICFESQLLDAIPHDTHDVYMGKVITEKTVYPGNVME